MKGNFILYSVLVASIFYESVKCQRKVSPCPSVFSYDTETEDTWHGTLRLSSTVPLYGVNVDVIFDRKVTGFGAYHFNEATTSNYVEFRLENKNFKLDPGHSLVMNIYVRFQGSNPLLKQIRLNGQNVCVDIPAISAVQPVYSPATPSNSQFDFEATRKPLAREIPNFESNYDTTTRRNIINNNNNNNRNSQTTTQSWINDGNSFNNKQTTTLRSGINNKPYNQNNNNVARTTTKTTTQLPYNSYDQVSTNNNGRRPSNNDDRIYYENTERDIFNPQSNRGTDYSYGSESSNNQDDPVTYRPYEQRISTTTRRSNTRSTTNSYTTKHNYFPGDLPFFNTETTTHSILSSDSENDCGSVIPKTNPLIIHGLETYPGNFPWHAALYLSEIGSLKYICGGSLISMSSVLTAAHCITKSKSALPINNDILLVYLGKHNLQKWTGQEQDGKVIDIIVNDEYDPERFYSDIAILKMKDPFRRTNYVRPVCLWNFDSDLKHIVDKLGSVPGWGYNENGLVSEDLTYIKMPVVTHETCIWSNRDFFSKVTSEKSFCAGFRNGTSICNGDSGGGMVFKQANKWYIRGVVSVSIALQNTLRCDPEHFSVFVDVAKYSSWLKQNI